LAPITYRRLSDWLVPGMIALMTCAIGWVAQTIQGLASAQNRLSETVAVAISKHADTERRVSSLEDDTKLHSDLINELLTAREVDTLRPRRKPTRRSDPR
jgi:hypothetical protein